MDEEAAQQFSQLLDEARTAWPEAHWTPSAFLSYLIAEYWIRKQREHE